MDIVRHFQNASDLYHIGKQIYSKQPTDLGEDDTNATHSNLVYFLCILAMFILFVFYMF